MAYEQHQAEAKRISAQIAIVIVSDTRTVDSDTSGKRIAELAKADGHLIVDHRVCSDDDADLRRLLDEHLQRQDIDVILTTGGTGVSKRDQALTAVEVVLAGGAALPGFGELFRMLSWEQIGSGAMLSRAAAGIAKGKTGNKLIFAMPGSIKAVELAMSRLILPELRHLIFEMRK
jgi:molybdenum cofactor biosynthesis protein B